jgi:hypothetical protein
MAREDVKMRYLEQILSKSGPFTFKQLNHICNDRPGGLKSFRDGFLNKWRMLPWLTILPEKGMEKEDSLFTFIVDTTTRRALDSDAKLVPSELDEVAMWKRRATHAEDALKLVNSGVHVPENRDMVTKVITAGQEALLRKFGHDTQAPDTTALQELTTAVRDLRICAGIRRK